MKALFSNLVETIYIGGIVAGVVLLAAAMFFFIYIFGDSENIGDFLRWVSTPHHLLFLVVMAVLAAVIGYVRRNRPY